VSFHLPEKTITISTSLAVMKEITVWLVHFVERGYKKEMRKSEIDEEATHINHILVPGRYMQGFVSLKDNVKQSV
jgi:hypothetical protein